MIVGRYSGWIWLCAALIIIALLKALTFQQPGSSVPLSVQSARSDGALALYRWLGRIGYHVDRETNRIDFGPRLARGTTVMLLSPQVDLTRRQAAAALAWVRYRAGRLVVVSTGDEQPALLRALHLDIAAAVGEPVQVKQPILIAPPVRRLSGSATAVVDAPDGGAAAAVSSGPVVTFRPLGSGEVWIVTAPSLLENNHIGKKDNRRLALNLAGSPTGSIMFSELEQSGATASGFWLTTSAWGVALLFAIAVLLLYRWLSGWRLGPPLPSTRAQMRPAGEYIRSMAGLLRRAHRRREVLAIYQRQLQRRLVDRYGQDFMESGSGDQRAKWEQLLTTPTKISEDHLLRQAAAIVECEKELSRTRV